MIDLCLQEKKKVIGLLKDELDGRIMTEFVALRPKTYAYQIYDYNDGNDEIHLKKQKEQKYA